MKRTFLFLFVIADAISYGFIAFGKAGVQKTLFLVTALLFSVAGFATERNVTLHIEEMNCQLCVYLVNKELRNLDGVISTKGDFNTRLVKVVADEKVTDEQLVKAVDKLHYHAVVQNQK